MRCPPLLALAHPKRFNHADFWWRIERPFAHLLEAGVDARVGWLGDDDLPTDDLEGRVVVVQRTGLVGVDALTGGLVVDPLQARRWVGRLKRAGAAAVVADLDDDTLSDAYLDWLDASGGLTAIRREKLVAERDAWRAMVAACDAVTVSTPHLAQLIARYTPAPAVLVPNAIDVDWFRSRLATPWAAPWPLIGWAGGRRPDADLAPMAKAWRRLAVHNPDLRFVVAGWQPEVIYRELDAVDAIDRVIRMPWAELAAYPPLYQVDVGCCPLAPGPFNRAKSPIKLWEYTLAGAAVVASPTVYGGGCCRPDTRLMPTDPDGWEMLLDHAVRLKRCGFGGPEPLLVDHVVTEHGLVPNLEHRAAAYRAIVALVEVAA